MVTEKEFSNFVFDYSSVFEQDHRDYKTKKFTQNRYRSPFTYHAASLRVEDNTDQEVKETWPSAVIRSIITYIGYVFVICLFPVSSWVCVKRIHALERIVLMRLGKMQSVRGPGITFILPYIDNWTRVDLRPKIFNVSTSQLLTSDGGIVSAETEVEYRVSDVIHYVTKLHNQERSLKDLGSCCLINLVSEKDQEDLERNRELINSLLKDELNQTVMNWGLEILNVSLYSVKVLKPAEPVDAIGTLICALKAATGQSSEHTAAVFPFASSPPDSNGVPKKAENVMAVPTGMTQNSDAVNKIRQLADIAVVKGGMEDLNSTFKLEVVGNSTRNIYCCFENGHVSVFENASGSLEHDVGIKLTEDNLSEFLTSKISPLQAYMAGKISVSGDWNLLRLFAKVFE